MDRTGTAMDQQQNQDYQQFTQSSFFSQHPDLYPTQPARSNSDSSQRTSTSASLGDSTQLISPTSDILNEMASAINEGYPQPVPLPIKDMGMDTSNVYGYNTTSLDQSGYDKPSTSSSFTSSSSAGFQNEFGLNGINYPVDGSGFMNGSQYSANTDFNFQKLMGQGYDDNKSAAIWEAAQRMFANYDFINANTHPINQDNINNTNNQSLPTSASTQALFQSTDSGLQKVPIDQARLPLDGHTRSPSPLYEVDEGDGAMEEGSSPELTEIHDHNDHEHGHRRRASDTTPSRTPTISKRRNASLSISTGTGGGGSRRRMSTSHLDPEEKARRAAAAEGLDKGDKRRMQNKLAQRAFRTRSKIVNKSAAGRLEHLEQLTERQAGRIGNLTELVGRLQKENYALKSAKFQEELMKSTMKRQDGT